MQIYVSLLIVSEILYSWSKALILKFLLMVIFADVARDKSKFLIHILSLTVVLRVNLMILEVIVCKFDIWFGNTFHIGSQTVEVSMITKLKSKRIDSLFLFNIVHCSCLLTLLSTGHDELQVIIILRSASRVKSATDSIAVTLRSLISCSRSTYLLSSNGYIFGCTLWRSSFLMLINFWKHCLMLLFSTALEICFLIAYRTWCYYGVITWPVNLALLVDNCRSMMPLPVPQLVFVVVLQLSFLD